MRNLVAAVDEYPGSYPDREAELTALTEARAVLEGCSPAAQPDGVHTIPVPRGWSPEQAWEAISRGDLLTDLHPSWVNVRVRDGVIVELCSNESVGETDDDRDPELGPDGEEPEDERWTFRACPECGGAKVDEGPGEPHPAWPRCSC